MAGSAPGLAPTAAPDGTGPEAEVGPAAEVGPEGQGKSSDGTGPEAEVRPAAEVGPEGEGKSSDGSLVERAPAPAPAPAPSATDPSAEAPPSPEEVVNPEEEPAALPAAGPPAPGPSSPQAVGGAFDTPLPEAPDPADPSTIRPGPWRGRAWLGIGLLASIPLAGRVPAKGGVVAVVGEVSLGWRLRPFLALHTSISSFAHDAAQQTFSTVDGEVTELAYGRITAFDLVTARFFVPLPRRIEPWGEVGLGVGIRRAPFAAERQAAGLARIGIGVDFWLAHSLTLGLSTAYRINLIENAIGHGLRAGADLGIHW